jgi:Flp pilus assembly pilin Flp
LVTGVAVALVAGLGLLGDQVEQLFRAAVEAITGSIG